MIARIVDRLDAIAARWPRLFAFVGMVWVVAIAFDQGRIIDLPDVWFLNGPVGIGLAGAYNALWWRYLQQRIEKRRVARTTVPAEAKILSNG